MSDNMPHQSTQTLSAEDAGNLRRMEHESSSSPGMPERPRGPSLERPPLERKKKSFFHKMKNSAKRLVTTGSAKKSMKERMAEARNGTYSGEGNDYGQVNKMANVDGKNVKKATWVEANSDEMSDKELAEHQRKKTENVPTRWDRTKAAAAGGATVVGGGLNLAGKMAAGDTKTGAEYRENGQEGKALLADGSVALGEMALGAVKAGGGALGGLVNSGNAIGEGAEKTLGGAGKLGGTLMRGAGKGLQAMGRWGQTSKDKVKAFADSEKGRKAKQQHHIDLHKNVADEISSKFTEMKRSDENKANGKIHDSRHDHLSNQYMSSGANLEAKAGEETETGYRKGTIDLGKSSDPSEEVKAQFRVDQARKNKPHLEGIEEAGKASTEAQAQKERRLNTIFSGPNAKRQDFGHALDPLTEPAKGGGLWGKLKGSAFGKGVGRAGAMVGKGVRHAGKMLSKGFKSLWGG